MATALVVSADSNAAIGRPCRVFAVWHTLNTSGTESKYELHDALTVTGTAVFQTRTTSVFAAANFGPEGIKFNTGVSVNKTGTGDGVITIIYE